MREDISIVSEISKSRKKVTEMIAITILIAISINIISNIIMEDLQIKHIYILFISFILLLASLLYLSSRFIKKTYEQTYEAFFVYDSRSKKIIPVFRYDFGRKIAEYLAYLFFENPALKATWEEECPPREKDFPDKKFRFGSNAKQLLIEATEYFILSSLSSHLSGHFNKDSIKKENLKEYRREDVPEIYFKNRFLQLFSTSRNERIAFKDIKAGNEISIIAEEDDGSKETIAVWKKLEDGVAYYQKFDLMLPKNSVIAKPFNNQIKIDTDILSIMIKSIFEGTVAVIPYGFISNYMEIKQDNENLSQGGESYYVKININIDFKFRAFLSKGGWEYYNWIDSFLGRLEEQTSQEHFFDKIGWETALTINFINRKRKQISKQLLDSKQTKVTGVPVVEDNKLKDAKESTDSSYV